MAVKILGRQEFSDEAETPYLVAQFPTSTVMLVRVATGKSEHKQNSKKVQYLENFKFT